MRIYMAVRIFNERVLQFIQQLEVSFFFFAMKPFVRFKCSYKVEITVELFINWSICLVTFIMVQAVSEASISIFSSLLHAAIFYLEELGNDWIVAEQKGQTNASKALTNTAVIYRHLKWIAE